SRRVVDEIEPDEKRKRRESVQVEVEALDHSFNATILVARLLDAKRSRKTRRDRSSRLIDRRVAIETEIDAMEPPEHAERHLRARDIHEENLPAERAQRTFLAKESADAQLEPSVVDRHPERIADLEIALRSEEH